MAKNEILTDVLPFETNMPSAPEDIIVHNKKELYEKLDAGMKQIKSGKVIDAETVMERLKDEYGFQD